MMKTKKIPCPGVQLVLMIAVISTFLFSAGGWSASFPLQEEQSDTLAAPGTDVTPPPPSDSLQGRRDKPPISVPSRQPGAISPAPLDSLETTGRRITPPDTSTGIPEIPDTLASPPDSTGLPAVPGDSTLTAPGDSARVLSVPADTTTPDLLPTDSTLAPVPEPDTTAASPVDTMFGKTYLAYVGESMFINKRTAPFPATYIYRYGGMEGDSTFRVNLKTTFMQQSYMSHFSFPAWNADSLAIGPFDVRVESLDSVSIVFELTGYTPVPEPDIPEPVEEVAEEPAPQEKAPPQPEWNESPLSAGEYFSRGYIRAVQGKYGEASQDLQTALDLDSTLVEARLLRGLTLVESNDSTALDMLLANADSNLGDTKALFFLSYGYQKQGMLEKAFESYTKVVALDSSNAPSLFQLAAITRSQGDSARAGVFLDMAKGFDPKIDSVSAAPSPWNIPHEFVWLESSPRFTHFEEPVYPDSAADSLDCTLRLRLLIGQAGRTTEVTLAEPCDFTGFNEAARAAAMKWTFSPAKVGDRAVKFRISVPYTFHRPEKEPETIPAVAAPGSTAHAAAAVPDTGEVRPRLTKFVQPEYPPEAIADSVETTVVLRILVGTDGSVVDVVPVNPDTLLQTFTAAAETAARRCRFRPGLRNGSPDTMWTDLPLIFNLTSPPTPPPLSREEEEKPKPVSAPKPAQLSPEDQNKAAAYIQGTMMAQQGKYDEALDLIRTSLESDPRDENSQLLYGLVILARETGKRMDEVTSMAGQPREGVYWWAETMPQMTELMEAAYPESVATPGAEGTVVLYVLVNVRGTVEKVTVAIPHEESSFNTAAEEAARGCLFTPGTIGGQPVKVWTRLPYEFKPGE